MTENALEILQSWFFVSVSSSGMGAFVKNKGMAKFCEIGEHLKPNKCGLYPVQRFSVREFASAESEMNADTRLYYGWTPPCRTLSYLESPAHLEENRQWLPLDLPLSFQSLTIMGYLELGYLELFLSPLNSNQPRGLSRTL